MRLEISRAKVPGEEMMDSSSRYGGWARNLEGDRGGIAVGFFATVSKSGGLVFEVGSLTERE